MENIGVSHKFLLKTSNALNAAKTFVLIFLKT